MSKWRPAPRDCIYVIPDIHGGADVLQLILDRILPLRKSDGGKDQLVFLGDYVDRHEDSHKVIDICIDIEKKYGAQATFLMGNHEYFILQALDMVPGKKMSIQTKSHAMNMWLSNGGYATITGYMDRIGLDDKDWGLPPAHRIADIIPKEHLEFIQRLKKCHEIDDYIFVHGGMDPHIHVSKHEMEELVWDRSLCKKVLGAIASNQPLDWEKVIITGHNVQSSKKPIVTEKFMMLDCGSPQQLLVVELRSLEAFMSKRDNNRLVKYELDETKSVKGPFDRNGN